MTDDPSLYDEFPPPQNFREITSTVLAWDAATSRLGRTPDQYTVVVRNEAGGVHHVAHISNTAVSVPGLIRGRAYTASVWVKDEEIPALVSAHTIHA